MRSFRNDVYLKEEILSQPLQLFRKICHCEREFAHEFGVPAVLVGLVRGIVELVPSARPICWKTMVPSPEAQSWLVRLFDAIPVGRDLSGVFWPLGAWLLSGEEIGVIQYAKTEEQRAAIAAVTTLYVSRHGARRPGTPWDPETSSETRARWVEVIYNANVLARASKESGDVYAAYALQTAASLASARASYSDPNCALSEPGRAIWHASNAAFPNSIMVALSEKLKELFRAAPPGDRDDCWCNCFACFCWR